MNMNKALEITGKKYKEEIDLRDEIIDYLIMEDPDCETCPYVKCGLGCPNKHESDSLTCTEYIVRFFKNKKENNAFFEAHKENVPYPVEKQWQQIALWRLVDNFISYVPDFCDYCPVENCELDRKRPMIWDRGDADIRCSYCHYALFSWAVNRVRVIINEGNSSKRLLELFAPELSAVARESVSKVRERRAESYHRDDLPE